MLPYFLRRLLVAIPTVLGVIIIVFAMVRLAPGDPAVFLAGETASEADRELIRIKLGLNKSQPEQFWIFISNLVQGDLGESTRSKRAVTADLKERFPNTLELASMAILIALAVSIPAGIITAVRPGTVFDYLVTVLTLVGVSMPVFWFGLLAIMFFSVQLGWFPTSGRGTFLHVILPAVTLGVSSMAIITRMTRSAVLEVLGQDYIRTALAKGLEFRKVINKHALRNALIPVITIGGLEFGSLMAGAVITETVFSWPGIGRLLVESILARDYPVVQGAVLIIALSFIAINLIVDMLYGLVDPRIRYD